MNVDAYEKWIDEFSIRAGDVFSIYYNEYNRNNIPRLYVLAIVDDYQVVCKRWIPSKRRWYYFIKDMSMFYVWDDNHELTRLKS